MPGLVLANQVAILSQKEGWLETCTQATYRRCFKDCQPAGEEPNLSGSLEAIGQEPARVLGLSKSDRIAAALSSATEQAMDLGVFGSTSFAVDSEIFWGVDRLEDAIAWALRG